MNDNTETTCNLYLCTYNNHKYFGIPNEIEKQIQPDRIYESVVKIDNKFFLKAKPVGILESYFPNSEAMFFISYDKKRLSGIGRLKDTYWYIVDNNINNANKLDSLFNFIRNEKCPIQQELIINTDNTQKASTGSF
jgi:hypothetical protein